MTDENNNQFIKTFIEISYLFTVYIKYSHQRRLVVSEFVSERPKMIILKFPISFTTENYFLNGMWVPTHSKTCDQTFYPKVVTKSLYVHRIFTYVHFGRK